MDIPIRYADAKEFTDTLAGWAKFVENQAKDHLGNSIQVDSRTGSTKASVHRSQDTGVYGLSRWYASFTLSEQAGPLAVVRLDWKRESPNRLAIKAQPKVSKLPDYCEKLSLVAMLVLALAMIYYMMPWFGRAAASSDYRDLGLVALGAVLVWGLLSVGFYFGCLGLCKGLERLFMAQRVIQCRQFTDDKLRPLLEAAVKTKLAT